MVWSRSRVSSSACPARVREPFIRLSGWRKKLLVQLGLRPPRRKGRAHVRTRQPTQHRSSHIDRRADRRHRGRVRLDGIVRACRVCRACPPKVLLESAVAFDAKASTITLPLVRGRSASGGAIWYVVTDSSDRADTRRRGINFAPRLRNALGTKAVQRGRLTEGAIAFPGTVNFRPKAVVEPGEDGFPPAKVKPGALGDARYSPLLTTGNGIVLNPHTSPTRRARATLSSRSTESEAA